MKEATSTSIDFSHFHASYKSLMTIQFLLPHLNLFRTLFYPPKYYNFVVLFEKLQNRSFWVQGILTTFSGSVFHTCWRFVTQRASFAYLIGCFVAVAAYVGAAAAYVGDAAAYVGAAAAYVGAAAAYVGVERE